MPDPSPRLERLYRILRAGGWIGVGTLAVLLLSIRMSDAWLGSSAHSGYAWRHLADRLVTWAAIGGGAVLICGSVVTTCVLFLSWVGSDTWKRTFTSKRLWGLVFLYGPATTLVVVLAHGFARILAF